MRLIPLLILLLLVVSGCQLGGLIASKVAPRTVMPLYTPPPDQPLLVLVESRQNPGLGVPDGEMLTGYIIDDLKTYNVAPIIDFRELQRIRDENSDFSQWSISQIGQAAGARQVLYVDIRRLTLFDTVGVEYQGQLEAMVRMIDVETGRVMFPAKEDGWPIAVETPLTRVFHSPDLAGVRRQLLGAAGLQIGRLFHAWEP